LHLCISPSFLRPSAPSPFTTNSKSFHASSSSQLQIEREREREVYSDIDGTDCSSANEIKATQIKAERVGVCVCVCVDALRPTRKKKASQREMVVLIVRDDGTDGHFALFPARDDGRSD
jgi:hypothetical protein